jgi:uncharacterized membrane protein YozB (DUF420 family)
LVLRAAGIVALAVIVLLALRFYVRDPLHYLIDQSEQSFGRYWPHRGRLTLHIVGGTLALFMGPFQLWSGLRERHFEIHRWTGRLYVLGILIGGVGAFSLASYGEPRDFGYALAVLGVAWWMCVGMGFISIRRKRIDQHREWMIRGYVITFAFVVFRILVDLHVGSALGDQRFAFSAWLSWTIPLLITEVVLGIMRLQREATT